MNQIKTLIDRLDTSRIKPLDRMVAELSAYMTELEIDRAVDLINTMSDTRFDTNLTVDDAAVQMRILLGSERYEQVKIKWAQKNQNLIKDGRTKFIRLSDNAIFDGLDPEDNPLDYKKVTV